jgi:hypothetical protein
MTEQDVEDALKRLRKEVGELREELGYRDADARFTMITTALAAAMLALTAAPWFWVDSTYGDHGRTGWTAPDYGFYGLLAVVVVLATAGGTLSYGRFSTATTGGHWTLCGLGGVCGLVLLFLPRAVDDDVTSGCGLWLTLTAALVLAAMHGTHADALRSRRRPASTLRY